MVNDTPIDDEDVGAIERVLSDADLAIIATGHDPGCACRFCIDRFVAEVRAWLAGWSERRAA
jgi:hypothetical protein